MAQAFTGPGILYVKTAINPSPSNPLTEAEYMHWYDDDHIAEIVQTSGMPNAFRYFHVDKVSDNGKPTPDCPRPYLAFYPMPELEFTQGQEFKAIRVKSDMLPGTGICYDMADTDVGYYALVSQSGTGKKGSGRYLVTSEIEPVSDATDDEIHAFFDQQAEHLSTLENYQRSLRFRLLYARTNAQSRILKGLAPATDEPAPEPPTWLHIHEFSAEPAVDVRPIISDNSHSVLEKAKQNEAHAYRLQRAHGQKKFFEGAEMAHRDGGECMQPATSSAATKTMISKLST